MSFDLETTDRLLSTTRAVRKRLDLDRPVERETIEECLRLAIQAPTGSNRQHWRFVVVTDAAKRKALADLYRAGAGPYLDTALRDAEAQGRNDDARVFSSAHYLNEHMHEVPVHVIPCIEAEPDENRPPRGWISLMASIYPAVWSFQLALRSRGLGSVITTLHLAYADDASALLGIPDNVVQVGLLPVAYTLGTDFRPAKRRPIEEITHWDQW